MYVKIKAKRIGQILRARVAAPPHLIALLSWDRPALHAQSVSGIHCPLVPFYTRWFKDTGSQPEAPLFTSMTRWPTGLRNTLLCFFKES